MPVLFKKEEEEQQKTKGIPKFFPAFSLDGFVSIWQVRWQDKESENSECQLCKEKDVSKILYIKGTTKTALDHLKHIHGISGKSTNIYTQAQIHSLL